MQTKVPEESKPYYRAFQEIVRRPGVQYTIPREYAALVPGGAGRRGVSEFSSARRDEFDVFTNSNIRRIYAVDD